MARIQVLELPLTTVGDASETPFVLIVDQVEDDVVRTHNGDVARVLPNEADGDLTALQKFADQAGARAVLTYPGTLDVATS